MLDQLMWKDVQNQKGILLLGLFFLFAPYLIYFFLEPANGERLAVLGFSVNLSLVASLLTVVVMGATIVGTERQNRGMEFLLTLPVPRSKVLFSKALICLFTAAVIWGTYLIVSTVNFEAQMRRDMSYFAVGTAVVGYFLFSVAWMCSILFRGTAIAIAVSLTAATLILLAFLKYWQLKEWTIFGNGQAFRTALYSVFLVLGSCSFAYGCYAFIRRFTP